MAHPGGRPTVMTEIAIQQLEGAFANGATDLEACFIAGISKSTLYEYCQANPEFAERKEALKEMIKYQARKNIVDAIQDEENKDRISLSQWYIERRDRDFKPKSDLTTDNQAIQIVLANEIVERHETTHETSGGSEI